MQRAKEGEYVEEKNTPAVGRPSMLNFDITGDVTREITDLEIDEKITTITKTKATKQPLTHSRTTSDAISFSDPVLQSTRHHPINHT